MAVISMKQLLELVYISVTKHVAGTLRWGDTSSQKEMVSISSTYKKTVKLVDDAYNYMHEVAENGGIDIIRWY